MEENVKDGMDEELRADSQVFPCTNPKLTSGSITHLNYYNLSKVSTATELYKIEEKWFNGKGIDCLIFLQEISSHVDRHASFGGHPPPLMPYISFTSVHVASQKLSF
ncbi:hypothetical protein NC652_004710 [Populus alba x Populus x berolinensis]|nr:hypothetical protein NC652_004710 [Populus alba x Populus x berolinensis]